MNESGPLTQEQAFALIARTTDDGWYRAMIANPDGLAYLNAMTAILSAASHSVDRQVAACMIDEAPTGNPGTSSLTLTRPDTTATATIPRGFMFVDSRGVRLIASISVDVAAHQTSILVPLETLRQIDLVNNSEPAFDDLLAVGDSVDAIIDSDSPAIHDSLGVHLLVKDSSVATYASSGPIIGAEMDWLSALGNERGVRRQNGEDGEAYRLRVRNIQDAVSPQAVQRATSAASSQGNLYPVFMVEMILDQASADARSDVGLVFGDSPFCTDYLDDPLGVELPSKLPWRSLELVSAREARAYFRLSMAGPMVETDGATMYTDVSFADDELWGYPDGGLALGELGALLTIPTVARQLKAAGIQSDFYVEDMVVIPATGMSLGSSSNAMSTIVWTLLSDPLATPGNERFAWLMRDGLLSHTPAMVGVFTHALRFTFSDSSQWNTVLYSAHGSESLNTQRLQRLGFPFKPVVKIEGYVQSNGSTVVQLAGTFWVVNYVL
jgi:hypothetical protein